MIINLAMSQVRNWMLDARVLQYRAPGTVINGCCRVSLAPTNPVNTEPRFSDADLEELGIDINEVYEVDNANFLVKHCFCMSRVL